MPDGQTVLDQQPDDPGIEGVLHLLDAAVQRFHCVSIVHRNRLLGDDGTMIHFLVDEMDCDARHLHPVTEG